MDAFLQAAALVFTPTSLIYMFLGVFFGILCGAMPGLSAVMAVSILLPFTFSLDQAGIMMLLGTFCGAIYGGSITAILINTPGTANSAATCLDGYPMATKLGQPGRALSISTMASTFGPVLCLRTALHRSAAVQDRAELRRTGDVCSGCVWVEHRHRRVLSLHH